MARRVTLSTLIGLAMAFAVVSAGAAGAQPDPVFGKAKKEKRDKSDGVDRFEKEQLKAEKWAMKLAKADPATAERWTAMKAEKEQAKAEKESLREQIKAEKLAMKFGEVVPPPVKDEEKPDPRPTVLRYGTLPKEVPSWWAEVDADKDVQISLFEWRTAGRKVEEFAGLDRNNDGFLTVEEYLRATAPEETRRK
jgi:hypothetical protein